MEKSLCLLNAYTVPGNIFQISLNQIWIHNKIKTTDLHWKEQLGPVLQQMCGFTARPPAKPCNGEREQKVKNSSHFIFLRSFPYNKSSQTCFKNNMTFFSQVLCNLSRNDPHISENQFIYIIISHIKFFLFSHCRLSHV